MLSLASSFSASEHPYLWDPVRIQELPKGRAHGLVHLCLPGLAQSGQLRETTCVDHCAALCSRHLSKAAGVVLTSPFHK